MLNHNILKFVGRLLKLIDPFIEVQDVIEETGRRSGLGGGETRFNMLTKLFGSTHKLFLSHVLYKSPVNRYSLEELNVLQGGRSDDWH